MMAITTKSSTSVKPRRLAIEESFMSTPFWKPNRAGNEKMNKSSKKRRQKPMRGAFKKVAVNPAAVFCRRFFCP